MNTKPPACWGTDSNAIGVRVEISSEHSVTLPFDQLAYYESFDEGKEQRLHLVFATHEVTVHGESLRRIESALQRGELEFLAKLTAGQRSLITEGQPLVFGITVTEIDSENEGTRITR